MNLVILDDAEAEFNDAIFYYSGIQPELGGRFKEEISFCLQWITRG